MTWPTVLTRRNYFQVALMDVTAVVVCDEDVTVDEGLVFLTASVLRYYDSCRVPTLAGALRRVRLRLER